MGPDQKEFPLRNHARRYGDIACVASITGAQIMLAARGANAVMIGLLGTLGAASIQIAFNLGNALGAYFGGLPISFGLGPQYAALPGAAMALLGFVMFSVYCSLYGRNKTHRILSEDEMRG